MARQQPENKLQGKIKSRLENQFLGSFWIKIHGGPYQQAGIPDLIGCVQGRFFALEVKLPGKEHTTTKLQKLTIEKILQAGGSAAVVSDPEDAAMFVEGQL